MSDSGAQTHVTVVVFITLAVFNFLGSIIQGVAGIGDAIILQVLWYIACEISPGQFTTTPLGPEPVRAVAYLMYIRLLFNSPLVVYLGFNDSIFSWSMTIAMAVPSLILSIIGVVMMPYLNGGTLKFILGVSSFAFAILYAGIIVVRSSKRKAKVEALREKNVTLTAENEAVAREVRNSRNNSFVDLRNSFAAVNNNSIFFRPPAQLASLDTTFVGGEGNGEGFGGVPQPPQQQQPLDPDTGLPVGTTEAIISTTGDDIFVPGEAALPVPSETNIPPLTPGKLSPSRTMTYTRVRINRNLDENGKIRKGTKIGASVAASLAGLMASLTGVNAPPQIIFILLYDAPNYIVRVNFSAQSIPSNILRFFLGMTNGIFHWDQVPIFIVTIIFGYAGVFVGNAVGKLLGPKSFNIFVLCLLLLSSLVMVTNSVALLTTSTVVSMLITVAAAYWERTHDTPIVENQKKDELEMERRLYDALEELHRNNNSFIIPLGLNALHGGAGGDGGGPHARSASINHIDLAAIHEHLRNSFAHRPSDSFGGDSAAHPALGGSHAHLTGGGGGGTTDVTILNDGSAANESNNALGNHASNQGISADDAAKANNGVSMASLDNDDDFLKRHKGTADERENTASVDVPPTSHSDGANAKKKPVSDDDDYDDLK